MLTIRVVTARRYASTIHWTCPNEAPNASAKVGKPTLAMLVPSEDSSMDNERLASAHPAFSAGSAFAANGSSPAAMTDVDMDPFLTASERGASAT